MVFLVKVYIMPFIENFTATQYISVPNLIVFDDACTQTDEIEKKLNEDEYFLRKEIENMKELYYLQM